MLDLDELVRTRFGFSSLLPGQREVMEHLLAGHSAAAIFPTGGGKSLCYQVPALTFDGLTLVVSPLIALMKDQIDALRRRDILAHRLDSTLSVEEYREVMDDVRSGRARLLYVAPERFNNERFRQALKALPISLFAVDEAHCISEWGHNFRPDYLKLAGFARACGAERILALTATATPQVASDIARGLSIEPARVVRTPFYRPNLTLLLTPVDAARRESHLLAALSERPRGATLVYVSLQKTAERVAEHLRNAGHRARAYHAGMSDELRADVQDEFLRADDGIVVATIAFGMGVDKSNIRYVYHYNLPKSLENLAQEIGRAGRDGAPAICEVLVCLDDLTTLENFARGDTPSARSIQSFVEEVLMGDDDALTLDLHALARRHDIRPLVLRTLLTYLELDGDLAGGTPLYSGYRFRPLTQPETVFTSVEGERQRFLRGLFDAAVKKRVWYELDAQAAAAATSSDRGRVVRALDWLAERGLIELQPRGVRHRYQRLRTPHEPRSTAASLQERMALREAAELERLARVLELTVQDACQIRAIGCYFGDVETTPCGHCSHCLSGRVTLPDRTHVEVDPGTMSAVADLASTHPEVLADPRAMTRFLCGLSSPGLTAARLTRHPLFGRLAEAPFAEVLTAVGGSQDAAC